MGNKWTKILVDFVRICWYKWHKKCFLNNNFKNFGEIVFFCEIVLWVFFRWILLPQWCWVFSSSFVLVLCHGNLFMLVPKLNFFWRPVLRKACYVEDLPGSSAPRNGLANTLSNFAAFMARTYSRLDSNGWTCERESDTYSFCLPYIIWHLCYNFILRIEVLLFQHYLNCSEIQ